MPVSSKSTSSMPASAVTIIRPLTVEYSLTGRGKTLIPAPESIYQWAEGQMKAE